MAVLPWPISPSRPHLAESSYSLGSSLLVICLKLLEIGLQSLALLGYVIVLNTDHVPHRPYSPMVTSSSPAESPKNMLTQIWSTHESARTRRSQTIFTSILSAPTGHTSYADRSDRCSREMVKPRTTSSGGTPSELVELGLLWDRQAT